MKNLPPIDDYVDIKIDDNNSDSIGVSVPIKNCENKIKYLYELDDIDRNIIKYLTIYPEMTATTLGQILNLNAQTIRNHRNKPVVRYAMQIQQQTTDEILEECAKKAGRRLLELIADNNPLIALAACKLALTKQMKTPTDVQDTAAIVYRTTFAPDGSLVQDIVREEIGMIDEKKAK
jgi:hypothetical protein